MTVSTSEDYLQANCLECDWSTDGMFKSHEIRMAAHRHCQATGHTVRLDGTQILERVSDASSELAQLAKDLERRAT